MAMLEVHFPAKHLIFVVAESNRYPQTCSTTYKTFLEKQKKNKHAIIRSLHSIVSNSRTASSSGVSGSLRSFVVNTSAAYVPFLEHRCPAASDTREERTSPQRSLRCCCCRKFLPLQSCCCRSVLPSTEMNSLISSVFRSHVQNKFSLPS